MLCEDTSLHENSGNIKYKDSSVLKYLHKLPHIDPEIPAVKNILHDLKYYVVAESSSLVYTVETGSIR